jgi:hypothetical protein
LRGQEGPRCGFAVARVSDRARGGGIHGREVIREEYGGTMGRQTATVLYVLALIAVVVGVDVLFFRHQFWERLMVNVGIVLVFAAFGLRFLKRV